MSEERTCNSEDTQPCSFKAFFALGRLLHWLNVLIHSTHDLLARSEAECIVFAMEGLLLTHDLRSTEESGINDHFPCSPESYSPSLPYCISFGSSTAGIQLSRLDSTQMDKLGSFGRRWILGVRRVTVSHQIETKLAANRKETPLNVIKDRGFLVIGFFPELHFSN